MVIGYELDNDLRERLAAVRLPPAQERIANAIRAGITLYEMTDTEQAQAHARWLTIQAG